MRTVFLAAACLLATVSIAAERPAGVSMERRWVFTMTNLASDEALAKTTELMRRAKRAGYNGIVVSDSKFAKHQLQPKSYDQNVRRFRKACRDEGMDLVAAVFPIGYAAELLAADPNLAEGMPVRNAPFVVRGGKLLPADETQLVNGTFENWKGDVPRGWSVDKPGLVSFRDEQVRYQGRPTLRQEHAPIKGGVARAIQRVKVRPWQSYHLSAMVRTENCTSKDFRLFALDGDPDKGYPLCWQPPAIKPTADWTPIHATFCSAENTEVGIYLGSYNAKRGTVWYADVRLEPAGFVNVLRRDSLPVRIAGGDGAVVYAEGKDYAEVRDPLLGHDPNPGYFTWWHNPPEIAVLPSGRLKDGDRVAASFHFATIVGKSHQINCCLSEPKVYAILESEARWAKEVLEPDVYMMSHDEIRHCGWDDTCTSRKKTCGEMLAENIRRCSEILETVDPGRPAAVWSDMFDPHHNAHKTGWMYLARGNGPWHGSWEGLPPRTIVVNWHNNDPQSLRFFADRGNRQVLAGFYDDDPKRIVEWLEMARQSGGVCGVMYTTWVNDYSKLEAFMEHVRQFEKR